MGLYSLNLDELAAYKGITVEELKKKVMQILKL